MLVSRPVGRSIGIVDDRYLLAQPSGQMTLPRFEATMHHLIPATAIRMVPPAGSAYMRIASGVNPPIVMKEIFGEFSAYPQSADPAYLTVDPRWYDAHIVTRSVPILGSVTCNRRLFPALIRALTDVQQAGLGNELHCYSGCYAARTVARPPDGPALPARLRRGDRHQRPREPVRRAAHDGPSHRADLPTLGGFLWGGKFLTPDGMHFKYGAPPQATSGG